MAVATGILFALATMLSWGIADFFAKKAVDKIGNAASLILNQSIALGPIFIYAILFYKLPTPTLSLIVTAIITGFFGFLGYFYLYKGFKKGNLSVVSPISASWFVISTLIASFIFNEILMPLQILGVTVVFAGIFLASTNLTEFKLSIRKGRSNGVLEALIAMVAWGFAFALIKPVVDVAGPIMALLFVRFVAFISMFAWVGFTKTKIPFPAKLIFLFLVAAALLDAFGFASYNIGVSTEFVSIVSSIAAAYPAVTVLLARFFLKEKLVQTQQVGVGAILVGLALIALV
jgi:drug/metabolite transporter (DMT)-like permease